MKILFAISDSDLTATGSKAFALATRLASQLQAEVTAMTNEQWVADLAKANGLPVSVLDFQSKGISIAQRMESIDRFIETVKDITIPDSDLPCWKLLALDDFAGSQLLFGTTPPPEAFPEYDVIVMPIQGVDNNTQGGCGLYVWLCAEARKRGIPMVGFEASPLGNKQSMVILPMDHYCVRSSFGETVLISQGKATPEQVSLLTLPEAYILQVEQREFGASYLEHEAQLHSILNMGRERFVVMIPHHVAFLWEIRQILKQLQCVGPNLSVVIRADPSLMRRQYSEDQMILKLYYGEMNALPHVTIDTQVGPAYLLQRADLIISPLSSNLTQWATEMGQPTIICQQAGFNAWSAATTRWTSDPTHIPRIIQEMAPLFRVPVATAIEKVLSRS